MIMANSILTNILMNVQQQDFDQNLDKSLMNLKPIVITYRYLKWQLPTTD